MQEGELKVRAGSSKTQNRETGKEKYIFFKASINPLKKLHLYVYFFSPGSRPALKSSSMKKLDSREPKEQHEASTTNIHDLWFRELLVNKQARWRRGKRTNQISSDRGSARPPGPSVEPGLMWCVKRSLFGGFSLRLKKKKKCLKRKKPSSLGTKSRSTDRPFLLLVCHFHCFQWLTGKRAPEVVMNTFKIPPVSGWSERKRKKCNRTGENLGGFKSWER